MATNPSHSLNTGAQDALLAAYSEVCKSYHAIDEFRMKLLGLLPLASLIGLALLNADHLVASEATASSKELVGFAAIFASALTLALFSYEMRGIRRCHNLITEGKHLEEALGIGHGQFHVCVEEHSNYSGFFDVLNAKLTACAIYSIVFAGWLFIGLRFGFGLETYTCCVYALGVGIVLTLITYIPVRNWTAA
jgi:hypothetical protein